MTQCYIIGLKINLFLDKRRIFYDHMVFLKPHKTCRLKQKAGHVVGINVRSRVLIEKTP